MGGLIMGVGSTFPQDHFGYPSTWIGLGSILHLSRSMGGYESPVNPVAWSMSPGIPRGSVYRHKTGLIPLGSYAARTVLAVTSPPDRIDSPLRISISNKGAFEWSP